MCCQLSKYLEKNNLLPSNQHGFRPGRSTMTAWQEIQLDWALKTEQNLVTGVLLWDLSAAFDTLDCKGVCEKFKLFGVQERDFYWLSMSLSRKTLHRWSTSNLVRTQDPGSRHPGLWCDLYVTKLQFCISCQVTDMWPSAGTFTDIPRSWPNKYLLTSSLDIFTEM